MTQQEEYKHIAEWLAYQRRENAGFFDVFFYDKEDIDDSFVQESLSWLANFFKMPLPDVLSQTERLAQIIIGNYSKDEAPLICYSWNMLQEKGINNKSAFLLILTHELSHYYFYNWVFHHCNNRLWVKELACDYMAGAVSALKGIAGGKYKYVISQTEATITHPYGDIRKKCVEEAQAFVGRIDKNWTVTECEKGFNLFMMQHNKEVNQYLREHYNEIIQKRSLDRIEKREYTIEDIMRLPDTNLIKQKLLEYGKY